MSARISKGRRISNRRLPTERKCSVSPVQNIKFHRKFSTTDLPFNAPPARRRGFRYEPQKAYSLWPAPGSDRIFSSVDEVAEYLADNPTQSFTQLLEVTVYSNGTITKRFIR